MSSDAKQPQSPETPESVEANAPTNVPEFDAETHITRLPNLSGVYYYFNVQGSVPYVGKARDLKKRVSSYFNKTLLSPRITMMVAKITRVDTMAVRSEAEALLLENNLIKALAPRYNILSHDDKSYPYLKLTQHAYLRMMYYRNTTDHRHQCFGSFPSARAVYESMQILQEVFRSRTYEDTVFNNRTWSYLLYQIHHCNGPCAQAISAEDYARDVTNAVSFSQDRQDEVMRTLQDKMQCYAESLVFEQAAIVRDQIGMSSAVLKQQPVEEIGHASGVDILVVAIKGGHTCVNLATVRGGRHPGNKAYFPMRVEGGTVIAGVDVGADSMSAAETSRDAERMIRDILEAPVVQYYLDRFMSPVLVVSHPILTTELTDALAEQARRRISVMRQPQGGRRVWLEVAERGVELSPMRRLSEQGSQQARTRVLAETIGIDLEDPAVLRVECFDIGHATGETTQASCMVLHSHVVQNSEYCRCNVQDITPGDDYAAVRQVLTRRYQRVVEQTGEDASNASTIVLIGNGEGQVEVAHQVFEELGLDVGLLVDMVKGEDRKVGLGTLIFADDRPPLESGRGSVALMLVAQTHGEAYRFTITGIHAKRVKARDTPRLEKIEGVGTKRRQRLLARLGGLHGVTVVSVGGLATVEDISQTLAKEIRRQLY